MENVESPMTATAFPLVLPQVFWQGLSDAYARSHAQAVVEHAQWRQRPECVTANVTGYVYLVFL